MKILEISKFPSRWIHFTTITLCLLMLAGCATIFSGTKDKVSFSSDVEGIKIFIEGRLVGRTPIDIELQRTMQVRGVLVRFEKDGFKTQEFRLGKKFNNTAIWNLTFLPSWATDVLSGAWYEYDPLKYHVELEPIDKTAIGPEFYYRRWVHRYVMVNFDRILKDLSQGEGEYLNALAHLAMSGEMNGILRFLQHLKAERTLLLSTPSRSALFHRVEWIRNAYNNRISEDI